jgi:hypothetical protein
MRYEVRARRNLSGEGKRTTGGRERTPGAVRLSRGGRRGGHCGSGLQKADSSRATHSPGQSPVQSPGAAEQRHLGRRLPRLSRKRAMHLIFRDFFRQRFRGWTTQTHQTRGGSASGVIHPRGQAKCGSDPGIGRPGPPKTLLRTIGAPGVAPTFCPARCSWPQYTRASLACRLDYAPGYNEQRGDWV